MAAFTDNNTGHFDVLSQNITLIGPDGVTQTDVPIARLNKAYRARFAIEVNYGSQIGACIIMLLVYILMTPRAKLRRIPTIINIVALLTAIVHTVLIAWFPMSMWYEFYTVWSHDLTHVPAQDYRTSVAATATSIPLCIAIEAALWVQAWTMIQLWPDMYKWPATILSVLVTLLAVGFKFADTVMQCLFTVLLDYQQVLWVRKVDLAFMSASVFWFCFLFNVRLAIHMIQNRSILPSVKGMSAMEILVLTNAVLMCIPACFAGLEYGQWAAFEFGSLTATSVVIVLPLGTLAAQRIANPSAFSQDHNSTPSSSNRNEPFLKSWHSTTVSSRVESNSTNNSQRQNSVQNDPDGFAKYGGSGDVEKGVRVARQIEHHEEMDL
ncbi:fungal pheromone mating factor STE2 GPCR-domain-containing protein [Coniochaeta sp. 2T2.1]|nr:fungal pheromone mating factor STE2 GPCR-domain-containing protein [Coniochaeta sp. 2T2.1]